MQESSYNFGALSLKTRVNNTVVCVTTHTLTQVSSRKTRRLLDKSKTFHVACGVAICIFSGKNCHLPPQLICLHVSYCVRVSMGVCSVWINGLRLAQHSWRTSCDVRPAGHVCSCCQVVCVRVCVSVSILCVSSHDIMGATVPTAVYALPPLIHSCRRDLASHQSSHT